MWKTPLRELTTFRTSVDGFRYGVEVEVEYRNPIVVSIPSGWTAETDGSLRRYGIEYITNPILKNTAEERCESLFDTLKGVGTNVVESPRTSIHVHANCQHLTWGQWLSCATAYWFLEEVFLLYAGKNRKGNLFCLGAEEAGGSIYNLIESFKKGEYFPESTGYKYSALNLEPVSTLGTMEFRALGGEYDMRKFRPWLNSIDTLMREASTFENPRDVLLHYDKIPSSVFARQFLGTYGIPYDDWMANKLDTNYSQLLMLVFEAENMVSKFKPTNKNVEGDM